MRLLADQRSLTARELRKASASAIALLGEWHDAGWLQQRP
jgi:50S ribosomal protein L16 3-hydroxylase